MIGWPHRLNEHEFEQALGISDGEGGLASCSPCGHKELDMAEQLNNNHAIITPNKYKKVLSIN